MDFAIELLKSNIYHYNEIAEVLGYQNYSYFSRIFKKYYEGITDSDFFPYIQIYRYKIYCYKNRLFLLKNKQDDLTNEPI